MPSSVPTTRPPRGVQWWMWTDITGCPPWTYDRIAVWRSGWHSHRIIQPRLRPAGPVRGLWWSPAGDRLSAPTIVKRLSRSM